ncbi:ABC transporter ATP-binding protein [Caballeronia sp. AZ7_KS35]|uniref:ABC transporter ATP-binding protein n=1 Tax=Caballeronia sp. AZ7_KS35 TaxID=2921762 RepID=UPI002028AF24|nr:ABC transporter ATP-binding protein [Caballeronia sp. AZ7_KS35]
MNKTVSARAQHDAPFVKIRDLRVTGRGQDGKVSTILHGIDLDIAQGEVLALIGESGSGKTTIALSMIGQRRRGTRIEAQEIVIGEHRIQAMQTAELRRLYGRDVAYVPQSAAASFNPALPIMRQVVESALLHRLMTREQAERRAVQLFREMMLPEPEKIGERYPHQVSGGQLQRLLAAMALVTSPRLVIFDEPTTALDVTTQVEVLRAFKKVVKDHGVTALYVSHDLAVVAQMADRIVVLKNGAIVESAGTEEIIHAPQHPYTQSLIAAAEPAVRQRESRSATPLLQINGLNAGYGRTKADGQPAVPVLQGLSLSIARGATYGVIGESGSGKSTLASVIAGYLAPASGTVRFDGEVLPGMIAKRTKAQLRRIQYVYQNADTALNPSRTVREIIGRPLRFYDGLRGGEQDQRVADILDMVRLPASLADRYCAEISGGQKQRVNLARALAAGPELVLCDEITSALDTVVASAILDLLGELQREKGLSYMFVSHDLRTVGSFCDDILVLHKGRAVEETASADLHVGAHHAYTELLLSSVPTLDTGWLERHASTRQGAVQP